MKKLSLVLAILILSLTAASCSSKTETAKDAGGLAMDPVKGDTMQITMSKSQANLNSLIANLHVFNDQGVQKATANLMTLSDTVSQKTDYDAIGSRMEWEGLCQEQVNVLTAINDQVAQKNYEAAADSVSQLLGVCVKCHKPYRVRR